ncbi:serine/threonine-protein kinase PLK4 [Xenopus laevis]|uniref:Serine/threonine-protein kinase PLK4 n=1 Tax=Xenopus laevis TaxID=8355 RepID=PLK4_XENLA|nr:serine/threonine-protein kinase PLK4 [Xenopus laevis]Q6PAD2.1 RecName: Full=Serine/threonine-protein kinase PLK4; AltName: Full=Polo-like kinase 4; Short=PLK-4; AltName: Full=Serine/threonine-protein kinase Sak [Xenopus laevis]AAH60363.1 MGC68791 protein [Xenopus laevis]
MAGSIGERREDFKVLNLLGKGSFACVYRAQSINTGIDVAIKMIDKKAMQKVGMVQRVRNEVEIHCQLKHPSILELYNYFEDSNYVYLILEMCHNGEVNRYLKNRKKPFAEDEARHFMHQIVTGMLYLHSHGILHRDLTLSNLLLSSDMNIKIADFGLATQLKMPNEKHFTMCGTPNYIAPEIATRSAHGLESDVWSLGCMLYTFLVGRPPFDTDTVKNTLNKIVLADYEMPDFVSREAKDLIFQLLRKNPADRLSLSSVLDHAFMTGFSNVQSKVMGAVEDSMDSGHATISTGFTGSSGVSISGRFQEKRILSGPSLPNKVNIFQFKDKHPTERSNGGSFHNTQRENNDFSEGNGRKPVACEDRPHSRYLRRAHSSDRSGTSQSQTYAKPSSYSERCHSVEMLAKPTHLKGYRTSSPPNSYGDIPQMFTDERSLERHTSPPVKEKTPSEFMGPAKQTAPRSNDKAETVQQWFGAMQLNGQFKNTPDTSSVSNMGGDFYSQQATQNGAPQYAWNDVKRKKNTDSSIESVLLGIKKNPGTGQRKAEKSQFGEQSKSRVPQQAFGSSTLRSIISPLNAERLKPIRQKTKNAVVSILESGEVCMEFLKEQNSQERVKEVLRISCDGNLIYVYHPNEGKGFPLVDRPPSPPENRLSYTFDSLPEKYWKKYQYAAKFIKLVRSKTPKVTYYTRYAKCMLMENSPTADVEVCFYDGAKIHKTSDVIRVIEKSGRSYTLEGSRLSTLSDEVRSYLDHANESHCVCLSLESAINTEEKKGENISLFPITFGRRPALAESPKTQPTPSVDSARERKEEQSYVNRVLHGSAASPPQMPNLNPSLISYDGSVFSATTVQPSPTSNIHNTPDHAQVLKSVFVENVGWASQLNSGAVWVQFNDGSQLVVQPGVSSIIYTAPNGQITRHGENDKLPEYIKSKLQCLSSILMLFASSSSR